MPNKPSDTSHVPGGEKPKGRGGDSPHSKTGTENVPEGNDAAAVDQQPGIEVHTAAAAQGPNGSTSPKVNRSKDVPKKNKAKNSTDNGDAASKAKKSTQPAPSAQESERGQGLRGIFDVFKTSSGTGTSVADSKKDKDGHTKKSTNKQGRDDIEGIAASSNSTERKKELPLSETIDDTAMNNTAQLGVSSSQTQPRTGQDTMPPKTPKGASRAKEAKVMTTGKGSKTGSDHDPASVAADSSSTTAEDEPHAAIDKKPAKSAKTERDGTESKNSTRSKTGQTSDAEVQSVTASVKEETKIKKNTTEREEVMNATRAKNSPARTVQGKAGLRVEPDEGVAGKDEDVLENQSETSSRSRYPDAKGMAEQKPSRAAPTRAVPTGQRQTAASPEGKIAGEDAEVKSKPGKSSADSSRTIGQTQSETRDAEGKEKASKDQATPAIKKKAPASSSSRERPPATSIEHGSGSASRIGPDEKSGKGSASPQGPIIDPHNKKGTATNLGTEQTQKKPKSDEGTDEEHGVKKLLHKIIGSGSHSGAPIKEDTSEGKDGRTQDPIERGPKTGKGEAVTSLGAKKAKVAKEGKGTTQSMPVDKEIAAKEEVSPPTIGDAQQASEDTTGGEGHAKDAEHIESDSKSQAASLEQSERDEVDSSTHGLQSNPPSKPPSKPENPPQSSSKSSQLAQAGDKAKGEGKLTEKSEVKSNLKKQAAEGISPPPTTQTISEEKRSTERGRSIDGNSAQSATTNPKLTRKQEPPKQTTKVASAPAKERLGESSAPTPATKVQTTNSDATDSTADCEHDEFECRKCRKVVRRDSLPLHTHPKTEVKKPATPIVKASPTPKATGEAVKKPPQKPAVVSPDATLKQASDPSSPSSPALPSKPIPNTSPQAAQKPKQQSSTPQSTSKPVIQKQATSSSNATTSPRSSAPRLAPTGKAPPKSSSVPSTKSTEVASKPPKDTSTKNSSNAGDKDSEENTSSQLGQVCEDETCDECHQIVRKRCGKCDQVLLQS